MMKLKKFVVKYVALICLIFATIGLIMKLSFLTCFWENVYGACANDRLVASCMNCESSTFSVKGSRTLDWQKSKYVYVLKGNKTATTLLTNEQCLQCNMALNTSFLEKYNLLRVHEKLPELFTKYFKSHSALPRALPFRLYKLNIKLLESVSILLQSYGVRFYIGAGTLLGSVFYHDLLPWNDDLDIYLDYQHLDKFKAVFQRPDILKTFGIFTYPSSDFKGCRSKLDSNAVLDSFFKNIPNIKKSCNSKYKVYFKKSNYLVRDHFPWNFPFVDVILTYSNGTHVYTAGEWVDSKPLVIPVDKIYPSTSRPFHTFWIPAPNQGLYYLNAKYKDIMNKCVHRSYNHIQEYEIAKDEIYAVDCDLLRTHYPHVKQFVLNLAPDQEIIELEGLFMNEEPLYFVILHKNKA